VIDFVSPLRSVIEDCGIFIPAKNGSEKVES